MHLCDCTLGIIDLLIQNVRSSTVDIESWIHRHPKVFYYAVLAKNLTDMVFLDVSGQCLDNNFCASRSW